MDWHVKPQWGSYSWDKRLFSDPTDAIQNYLSLEYFTTVQAAIDDPNAIDDDILQLTIADFDEDILYDRNTILTLSGGYFCNFSSNPSTSSINSLKIRAGTIILEYLILH